MTTDIQIQPSLRSKLLPLPLLILRPAQAFTLLRQQRNLWLPALLIATVAFLMAYLQTSKLNWESAAIQQYYGTVNNSNPLFILNSLDQVSAEHREPIMALQREMQQQAAWAPWISAVLMPLQLAVLAGLFFLIFLATGQKARLDTIVRQLWYLYVWPFAAMVLIFILSTSGQDSLTLNQMKIPPVTSLTYYLTELSPLWQSTLSSIDLINIWIAVLMYQAFNKGLGIKSSIALLVVAGCWFSYFVIKHLLYLLMVADCAACTVG